jgi:hypothetical protein
MQREDRKRRPQNLGIIEMLQMNQKLVLVFVTVPFVIFSLFCS